MIALELTTVGTSTGVVIPEEMLTRLKLSTGKTLYAVETAEGYLLTSCDPTISEEVDLGAKFMTQYRDAFKALAE